MLVSPKFSVLATPVVEDVDINTRYDMSTATVIGHGGFSEVLAVRHIPSGQMRALKVMPCHALKGRAGDMFTHEKEILRRTCHPSVVSLMETIKTTEKMYMSLDLMSEDLFEFILHHKSVSESAARVISFQLLSAIHYLHEQSIVHRDIKPENILINTKRAIPGKLYPYGCTAVSSSVDCGDGTVAPLDASTSTSTGTTSAIHRTNPQVKENIQGTLKDRHTHSVNGLHADMADAKDTASSSSTTTTTTTTAGVLSPLPPPPSPTSTSVQEAVVEQPLRNIHSVDPSEVVFEVKLTDFGLAKLVLEWDVRNTPCGTSFYIAPEVLRSIEAQGAKPLCTNQRLVKSIDVWSAGVVLFVLLSGRPPFYGQVKTTQERRALLHRIDRGILFPDAYGWAGVSEEAKDLLQRMMQPRGDQRITAAEALRHPFFIKHGFTRPIPGGDGGVLRKRVISQSLVPTPREAPQQQQQQSQPHSVVRMHKHNHVPLSEPHTTSLACTSGNGVGAADSSAAPVVERASESGRCANSHSPDGAHAPRCLPPLQSCAPTNTVPVGGGNVLLQGEIYINGTLCNDAPSGSCHDHNDDRDGKSDGKKTNVKSDTQTSNSNGNSNSSSNDNNKEGMCVHAYTCLDHKSHGSHAPFTRRGADSVQRAQLWSSCASPPAPRTYLPSHPAQPIPPPPQRHKPRTDYATHTHPRYTFAARPSAEAFASYGTALVSRPYPGCPNNAHHYHPSHVNHHLNGGNHAKYPSVHMTAPLMAATCPGDHVKALPAYLAVPTTVYSTNNTPSRGPMCATIPPPPPFHPPSATEHRVLLSGEVCHHAVSREEQQFLHDAFNELQQDVITVDDAEGEDGVSSHDTHAGMTIPFRKAPPSRPAVMNNKIKVGPQLLRRKGKGADAR